VVAETFDRHARVHLTLVSNSNASRNLLLLTNANPPPSKAEPKTAVELAPSRWRLFQCIREILNIGRQCARETRACQGQKVLYKRVQKVSFDRKLSFEVVLQVRESSALFANSCGVA
jgi:hypothetical protein